jgi:hypothetical protein
MLPPKNKAKLKLVGSDGNAFCIMGRAQDVARKNGYSKAQIEEYIKQAISGDYDHLLAVTMDWFDVN